MIAANFKINHITHACVAANVTVNKLLLGIQLVMIENVIFGDIINGKGGVGMVIDINRVVSGLHHHVAHFIVGFYRGMNFDFAINFTLIAAKRRWVHFDVVA